MSLDEKNLQNDPNKAEEPEAEYDEKKLLPVLRSNGIVKEDIERVNSFDFTQTQSFIEVKKTIRLIFCPISRV